MSRSDHGKMDGLWLVKFTMSNIYYVITYLVRHLENMSENCLIVRTRHITLFGSRASLLDHRYRILIIEISFKTVVRTLSTVQK